MAELKYAPVRHDHAEFLLKARARKGFAEAYDALALEYQIANQMLAARSRAGLTQEAVAERMGTTKSAISRLESAGKHAPSLATLERYALAVGCDLEVRLIPRKSAERPTGRSNGRAGKAHRSPLTFGNMVDSKTTPAE